MKTELNIALEGTRNGDVMGGSCGPGDAFRRFFGLWPEGRPTPWKRRKTEMG